MDNLCVSQHSDPSADLVAQLWDAQSVWSQAANKAKAKVGAARVGALILITAAAVLATLSPALSRLDKSIGTGSAIVAAVCLALMPIVRVGANRDNVQTWSRLRSVSEALKSEVYRYLAGAAPFDDRATSQSQLRQRTNRVLGSADDLLPFTQSIKSKRRPVPAIHDVDSYIELRLRPQMNGYYLPQGAVMGRRARQAETLQIVLAVAAALIGLGTSLYAADAVVWLAVIATISGAVTAHAAANRYTLNQLEYLRTAQHLQRLLGDPAQRDDLVNRSEHVISIQNEAWMAEVVQLDPGHS